jgi:hypothetical protein
MTGRWVAYSLGFVALLAGVAILLPTHYSMGLLAALQTLLGVLIQILVGLVGLILLPLAYLWHFIISLLGATQPPAQKTTPVAPELKITDLPATPSAWFEFLKSIIFWGVIIGLVIYSLYSYLRNHKDFFNRLRELPWFSFIVQLWKGFLHWWRGARQEIVQAVQAGWQRLRVSRPRPEISSSWQFVNLRRLSPRQRMIFFYLALVHRGSEHGYPRSDYQTPDQYSLSLVQSLQTQAAAHNRSGIEVTQEITELTAQFVEARYSLHAVTEEKASLVQRCWEKILRALRKVRHSSRG